ncbi:MAG: AEC family transporter [Gemmatimonadota bacterium]|nr:AEC family transporter [Gemmatimonadota bacterium]
MTPLVGTIAPVFGVMALGFLAVRLTFIGQIGTRRLVLFVFNAAIPIMLFYRIASIDFPEQIEWSFLLAFYGSAFATYAAGMAVGALVFGRPLEEQAIYGMGAGFSNTVLLGIPLLVSAFGPEATLPVFLIIAFHSATLLPVSVALMAAGRRRRDGETRLRIGGLLVEILANPIILGILLGLAANRAGVALPGPVDVLAGLMSTVAIPCALIALGASLAGYRVTGQIGPATLLAALKLLLHPLLAWLIAVPILGLGAPWAPVAVVMAGMPSGAMVYLFGARYGTATDVAAGTVVVASAASVVTLSILLVLMGA